MSPKPRRPGPPPVDGRQQHLDWLAMVEISGPFLTLPVLRAAWPMLDALEKEARDGLRATHATWRTDPNDPALHREWVAHVLRQLLEWGDDLEHDLEQLGLGDEWFALVEPGEQVKPDTTRLLGLSCAPGVVPTALRRGEDDERTTAPVDQLAHECRRHGIELGLATDGRWWTLVWAPVGGVTTTATFDAVSWPEQADREVVRAFRSLLRRSRFFAVPDDDLLVPLLRKSLESQEEVTEALGTQVRQAVELLVDAIGRADTKAHQHGSDMLGASSAHDAYRGAVAVMMRVVFLLFAEERGLLPADNDLYAQAYSAGRLCEDLEQAARSSSEEDLEHSNAGWMRLIALFQAVHAGVTHDRLTLPSYDGSIFDPGTFGWLARIRVDDRTVLHMLRAVQYVEIRRERRRLSFRALDVEQIGYVYEGLLSFEGRRAADTVVGLIGKQGIEEEVTLTDLEAHAGAAPAPADLAARLAEAFKDSKLGTPGQLAKRLTPLAEGERAEALRRLLAATGGDLVLAQRVLPFVGIIRTDLRGLPVVINRDALYVTESRLRKNTGTHYTPRKLAEQVVEGALEPLVYAPGPLQTAEYKQWKLKSSDEILALRVADIAMGSGAFLVAACRYLAGKLMQARLDEGKSFAAVPDDRPTHDAEADPLVIAARREIIEHCLYGVDINPMAVEMAKLSLWLVSMDPHRPFTFLDDRLVSGDSLLGITSIEQLEYMHLDPKIGRQLHEGTLLDYTAGVRSLVAEVAQERRRLATMPGGNLAELNEKRRVLAAIQERTEKARLYADLVVGSALAGARQSVAAQRGLAVSAAEVAGAASARVPEAMARATGSAKASLATDLPRGGFARYPLHWPLAFPEVVERGGFDAIVGNPPFLGGSKISGATGSSYREYLVSAVGLGTKGNADLVAYFLLRSHRLLRNAGQTGIIATNTLAQGDTREVGLDQILAEGTEIRQAVKSEPWPSRSVLLQFCAVWTSRIPVAEGAVRRLDGAVVAGINSSLDAKSRAGGAASRLAACQRLAFQASKVDGLGFTMPPSEARDLIDQDERNADVLFPYLNGQDLNSYPDSSSSRWIIDFHDWPLDRAATYHECFARVERLVKPERLLNNRKTRRDRWWWYAERAPQLYAAIVKLDRVIVITLHSKFVIPVMVPARQVFSHALAVFATDDLAMLGLLSSAPHYWWAIERSSTLETRIRYTPSDVFETLPRPELTEALWRLGGRLDAYRRDVMLARQAGLTATYNLVHDKGCGDEDIAELRRIHVAIDEEVMRAYGWDDLPLEHGFHDTRQGARYTVVRTARQEILDRLLELNHKRYAEEVAKGLHEKKKAKGKLSPQREGLFDA